MASAMLMLASSFRLHIINLILFTMGERSNRGPSIYVAPPYELRYTDTCGHDLDLVLAEQGAMGTPPGAA